MVKLVTGAPRFETDVKITKRKTQNVQVEHISIFLTEMFLWTPAKWKKYFAFNMTAVLSYLMTAVTRI